MIRRSILEESAYGYDISFFFSLRPIAMRTCKKKGGSSLSFSLKSAFIGDLCSYLGKVVGKVQPVELDNTAEASYF